MQCIIFYRAKKRKLLEWNGLPEQSNTVGLTEKNFTGKLLLRSGILGRSSCFCFSLMDRSGYGNVSKSIVLPPSAPISQVIRQLSGYNETVISQSLAGH